MGFNSGFKGLTSALDGGKWLTPRPSRLTPGEKLWCLLIRRLGWLESRYGEQIRTLDRLSRSLVAVTTTLLQLLCILHAKWMYILYGSQNKPIILLYGV